LIQFPGKLDSVRIVPLKGNVRRDLIGVESSTSR
jgi:hypothetical protein